MAKGKSAGVEIFVAANGWVVRAVASDYRQGDYVPFERNYVYETWEAAQEKARQLLGDPEG